MRIGLRTKLSLFSSLLVLGAISGGAVSVYFAEKRHLVEQIQQGQVETVQVLAQIAREALASKSELLLSSYLALVRRSRGLLYAMVLDGEGRVIAHSNVILVGQKPPDAVTEKSLQTRSLLRQVTGSAQDHLIDLALPIYLEGERVATARVGYSRAATDQLVDESLQAARRRVAVATVAALLGGVALALLFAFFMARPIRILSDGVREIAKGSLHHRLKVTSRDEFGELAEEFNLMAARLQELDQLKTDFTSNVTHELRSPLTSLRGYVDFLLRGDAGPLNEEQTEQLIVVKNNAARLAKFIDDLLDVAKIEAAKIELHPEPVALPRLAREMQVLFKPQAQEQGVALVNEVPESLPAVWADADKTGEILINLLSNAFKFTPQGGRVTLAARDDGDFVRVSVRDTGVGIPASELEKVFSKFEQVKPTQGLARKTKGTGLGLTIVKGFVEAHHGKVWLESEVGRGTTVNVTLPKARGDSAPAIFEEAESGPAVST
jgi:signal transduction histidine kinase